MEFLKTIKNRQKDLGNNLEYLNNGLSPITKSNIPLSPGCKACKNGTWWCLYVGYKCNATCWYCPQGTIESKEKQTDHPEGFQHLWIEDVKMCLENIEPNTIKGLSYSGGEPFLYLDKVIPFITYIKKEYPEIYQWIYTNGILVTEDKLKQLRDSGIDEIRFHIGATDCDIAVINKLKYASKIIDRVTIETPAMPNIRDYLINQNGLKTIIDYGVTQLNLSELYFVFPEQYKDYTLYSYSSIIRGSHISPIISRLMTYDIIEYVVKNNLQILCNDCSHESRDAQLLTRELNKNRLTNMW
jgi:pyruvate formate-lyase activating enzyme-like uncharacterized protein